jgi:hypothetical protein
MANRNGMAGWESPADQQRRRNKFTPSYQVWFLNFLVPRVL